MVSQRDSVMKRQLLPCKSVAIKDPWPMNCILYGFAQPNGHDQAAFLSTIAHDDLLVSEMLVCELDHCEEGSTYVVLPDDFCGKVNNLESIDSDNHRGAAGIATVRAFH